MVWEEIGYNYLSEETGIELGSLEPGATTSRPDASARRYAW
jgi:hypothetical protein